MKAKSKVSTSAKAKTKAAAKSKKPVAKKPVAKKPTAGKKIAVKAKPVAKKAAAKKPAAKPVSKAKAPIKAKAKVAAKPKAKVPAKPASGKKPAAKPTTKAAQPKAKTPVKPVLAAPPAPVLVNPILSGVRPAGAGRPSSRLAQLTVPSMAPSVASTAAKASFLQTISPPVIALPLPMAIKRDPKLANNWKTKSGEQLSDEELIAMPDSEYMNEKQLAAFRFKLMQLKRDILSNAGETTEHLREETVVVPDPADRATIEEEHALELRTRDRERKLLKKIEQAIVRIDAGEYGYCDETGEPIGVGRLLARPTATLSLEAQQRRELKQRMFGD